MENALKFVLLAVGLIIVVALVGYGFSLTSVGQNLLNGGMSQLTATTATMADMDKQLYDNTTVTGKEVVTAIKKYNDGGCLVIVITKVGGAVVYSSDLSRWDKDKTGADANCASNLAAIGEIIKSCTGWPTLKNTYGQSKAIKGAIGFKADDSSVIEARSQTIEIKGALEDKVTAGDLSWLRTSDWDGDKIPETDGTYNGTFKSTDADYISGSSSFKASLQMNENSEVKCVTFVQK